MEFYQRDKFPYLLLKIAIVVNILVNCFAIYVFLGLLKEPKQPERQEKMVIEHIIKNEKEVK